MLAPRLTVYPEFGRDPERWLDPGLRFAVLDRSDAEGLGRDDPGSSRSGCEAVAGGRAEVILVGRVHRLVLGRRVTPPRSSPAGRRPEGGRSARCWPACGSARRSGEDEIVTLFSARGPRWRRWPSWPTSCAGGGRRRGHLRAQPQHQLHQRVHVQVPVLRLLQGAAVAQPAGHALPADPRRHRRAVVEAGEEGATEVCLQGGIHPDFDGDYYIDVARR